MTISNVPRDGFSQDFPRPPNSSFFDSDSMPKNVFGTAIAAIWTPKRIVVAADSKSVSGDGQPPGVVNKIHSTGNIHFTFAGLSKCGETGFDAAALLSQGLQEAGSFKEKVGHAREAVENSLTAAIQHIHRHRPEDFKKHLAGSDALDVIFCVDEGGDMALSQIAFKIKRRGKDIVLEPRQKDYPNNQTDMMSVELIARGVDKSVIEKFLKGTTGQRALVHPEDTLKVFMDMAMAAEPDHVGYPINLIKLAAGGMTHTVIESP